ncbi:periplasmic heavy metal sensor [Paremcibacter congregatus]|uniref:periplasmic heavy metal sensor n=1 Tax=Paremcibacter congregatus TaxID=2043170 RepID=UPI0030ED6F6C|tara:strand:- start:14321 stop:14755 length:435 start_codon:yes stop_codon:yes gene_type:complete
MSVIRRIVFSLLLFLSIIIIGYFIGSYFHQDYVRDMENSHPSFHEMLNLTQDQREKLVPLEKKFSEEKIFYENQIRVANMELGDIMNKEKSYTPEVQAAVEKVHTAMGQLQKVTIIHLFDMRALLNEKQAKIFDDYVADVMHGL